jgi:hypothetical protein
MPTAAAPRKALAKSPSRTQFLWVVPLCLCVLLISVASSYLVMRSFLRTNGISNTNIVAKPGDQKNLFDRVSDSEKRLNELTSQLQALKNTPLTTAPDRPDYVSQRAVEELVQEHLFETEVKRVGNVFQVTPFSNLATVDFIPVRASIWNAYPKRQFSWDQTVPWQLRMSQTFSDGISLTLRTGGNEKLSEPVGPIVECDETKYSYRIRQVATFFKEMYPGDDWSKPCERIQVSTPLKGNAPTEYDEKTGKTVPVPVRAYFFRPTLRRVSEDSDMYLEQPLVAALVVRERGWWHASLIEWGVAATMGWRYDGFLSEEKVQEAKTDVERLVTDFTGQANLYSGFCGYGDCY